MIKSYKIRNISISPGLVLSPMSGVTTCAFRRLIKRANPGHVGLLVSEFISVEGMTRQAKRTLEMMRFKEEERPYCIQIFGYDIQRMRDAARMVEDAGVDIVDINCGCPAPKVVKRGGGCELMRQPDHLVKIVRAVKSAISIPLTLKMRSGWDEGAKNALDIAKNVVSEGVEALAIHGRTRTQLYRGLADWDIVRHIASEVPVPVLGSGDVIDRKSATERLAGDVQGLFIGRAAMFNPFVFSEIVTGEPSRIRGNWDLQRQLLEDYIELLLEEFTPVAAVGKIKQLTSQMCRSNPWKRDILACNTLDGQQEILRAVKAGTWSPPSLSIRGNEQTAENSLDELAAAAN